MSESRSGVKYGRLRLLTRDELTEQQREYYDHLMAGPRPKSAIVDEQGRLIGGFNSRLLDPVVGMAIQELGAALRFNTPALSDRQREIAILETVRHERCEYEWA